MKKSIKTNIIAVCALSVISLLSINVSALDYQKTINVGFNIQDTLTVSLSSPNLIIDDLMPGTASDSNIITVNVLSNNPYGYTLSSNVGNSTTYNTDELAHTSSITASPFTNLATNASITDKNNFDPNKWGYTYSKDGGTAWINANKIGGVNNTGYSGLPLYSTGEATLNEKTTTSAATGDDIEFKIAAKAASTQLSGEYQNIINFIATGTPAPTRYMQDLSLSECQSRATNRAIIVYDRRDESDYTVRYINGNCWMTQNLRITGNISAADSNFSSSTFFNTAAGGDLRGNSQIYTAAQSHQADQTDVDASTSATGGPYTINQLGAWYNYCAASAGEVCQNTTTQDATQDICPANWHLPSDSQFSSIISYSSDFSPIYGGVYVDGSLNNAISNGRWWSSISENNFNQYYLFYNNGNLEISYNGKVRGDYIRCILK